MPKKTILLVAALQLSLSAAAQETSLQERLLSHNAVDQNAVLQSASAYLDELTNALIELLDTAGAERQRANAQGVAIQNGIEPEVITRATNLLIRLRDPRSIVVLTGILGVGSTDTPFALAAFGEQAVPAVLAAVESPQSESSLVNSGLVALRCMVEPLRATQLSEQTILELRQLVRDRLTRPHSFPTFLWREIDLAIALEDASLRATIESLATDGEAVRALGVDSADLIARTQLLADERLQGVAARPYCKKL